MVWPQESRRRLARVLGCKSSRGFESPFPEAHAIVRLVRRWFVRRVFRAATVRARSMGLGPPKGMKTG